MVKERKILKSQIICANLNELHSVNIVFAFLLFVAHKTDTNVEFFIILFGSAHNFG
ncbi:hypothetical protein BH18THE1_BH18THE1_10110 [soil metagenome]